MLKPAEQFKENLIQKKWKGGTMGLPERGLTERKMKLQSEWNCNSPVEDNRCFWRSLNGTSWHFSHLGSACTVEGRGCVCTERAISLNPEMTISSTHLEMASPWPHSSVRGTQNRCSSSHLPIFLRLGADCPVTVASEQHLMATRIESQLRAFGSVGARWQSLWVTSHGNQWKKRLTFGFTLSPMFTPKKCLVGVALQKTNILAARQVKIRSHLHLASVYLLCSHQGIKP